MGQADPHGGLVVTLNLANVKHLSGYSFADSIARSLAGAENALREDWYHLVMMGIPVAEHPKQKKDDHSFSCVGLGSIADAIALVDREEGIALLKRYNLPCHSAAPGRTMKWLPSPQEPLPCDYPPYGGWPNKDGVREPVGTDLSAPRYGGEACLRTAYKQAATLSERSYVTALMKTFGISANPTTRKLTASDPAAVYDSAVFHVAHKAPLTGVNRALWILDSESTPKQQLQGFQAFCSAADSTRQEIYPMLDRIDPAWVLGCASKNIVDVIGEMPWRLAEPLCASAHVRAHVRAFLLNKDYDALFADNKWRDTKSDKVKIYTPYDAGRALDDWEAVARRFVHGYVFMRESRERVRNFAGSTEGEVFVWKDILRPKGNARALEWEGIDEIRTGMRFYEKLADHGGMRFQGEPLI